MTIAVIQIDKKRSRINNIQGQKDNKIKNYILYDSDGKLLPLQIPRAFCGVFSVSGGNSTWTFGDIPSP